MQVQKFFTSSYLMNDGTRSIGFTIRSSVSDGVRDGRLIGFDVKPDASKYSKFIYLSGEPGNQGVILPDTRLLVKVDDLFSGSFVGITIRREAKLYRKLVGDDKSVIFTMDRVPYDRPNVPALDLEPLIKHLPNKNWTPSSQGKSSNPNNDKRSSLVKLDSTSVVTVKSKLSSSHKKERIKARDDLRSSEPEPLYEKLDVLGDSYYSEVSGDLFDSNDQVIANCISKDVHMGKGIAVDFRKRYSNDYAELKLKKLENMSSYLFYDGVERGRAYMVTKNVFSGKPTKVSLTRALESLFEQANSRNIFYYFN